ncbi:2847_t:CDS:2, partial [Scutellospora calospora]
TMPGTITVLCYVTEYRSNSSQSFDIVDASAIMNSHSLNSSLKIFLKGFYSRNTTQEFSLPSFGKEDVVLVTGKFRVVEYINEKNETLSAIKIVINDLVHFGIELTNLPKFPALVCMTAIVQELPKVDGDDATMVVVMTDYMDQDSTSTQMNCYYLATAPHLMRVTRAIKKNSLLFINGEFLLYNNKIFVHVKNITFSGYQKSLENTNTSAEIPWESELHNEPNKHVSFAETIAERFDRNAKNKEPLSVPELSSKNKPSSKIKPSSKVKPSSVIKPVSPIKPFSVKKPSSLTDLAKDALTNSTELDLLPNSTEIGLLPNSTEPDLLPNSTEQDLLPDLTESDVLSPIDVDVLSE